MRYFINKRPKGFQHKYIYADDREKYKPNFRQPRSRKGGYGLRQFFWNVIVPLFVIFILVMIIVFVI